MGRVGRDISMYINTMGQKTFVKVSNMHGGVRLSTVYQRYRGQFPFLVLNNILSKHRLYRPLNDAIQFLVDHPKVRDGRL